MAHNFKLKPLNAAPTIPGDAAAQLAAELRLRVFKYVWASTESLQTLRASLTGELMRHGLPEWSGAAHVCQPTGSHKLANAEARLAQWAARNMIETGAFQSTPVVVCSDVLIAGKIIASPLLDSNVGAIIMGAPFTRPPGWFGQHRQLAWMLADAMPSLQLERVVVLGGPDNETELPRRIALYADARSVCDFTTAAYMRAGQIALNSNNCSEFWLIVCLDSLLARDGGLPLLDSATVCRAIASLGRMPMVKGVFLISGAAPLGPDSPINPGELARDMGHSFMVNSLNRAARRALADEALWESPDTNVDTSPGEAASQAGPTNSRTDLVN